MSSLGQCYFYYGKIEKKTWMRKLIEKKKPTIINPLNYAAVLMRTEDMHYDNCCS